MTTAIILVIFGAIIGTALCGWLLVRAVRWVVDRWANGEGWQ